MTELPLQVLFTPVLVEISFINFHTNIWSIILNDSLNKLIFEIALCFPGENQTPTILKE